MSNLSRVVVFIAIALFVVAASNAYINYRQNKMINEIVELIQTNYDLSEAQYQLNKKRIENVSAQSTKTCEALNYALRKGVKFD